MQKTNKAPSARDLRIFALVVAVGFLVIGALIPLMRERVINIYLVGIAGIVFVLGMIVPRILIMPREIWIKIGNVLGKINSTILFTLVYFLVFMTVGLLFKIFGRDRLHIKFRSIKSTMVFKKEISPFTEPF